MTMLKFLYLFSICLFCGYAVPLPPSGSSFYPEFSQKYGLPKIELSNWMGALNDSISDKSLLEITLPGTHDSGAYQLTKELLPGYTDEILEKLIELAEKIGVPINDVITPWALAQDLSFYDQLKTGIRYLDVRSGYDGKNWRTFHFELGNNISDLLKDVTRFLNDYQQEVVVLEVSHLIGDPEPSEAEKEDLLNIIETELKGFLLPRERGWMKIGDMVKDGRRAIVTVDDSHDVSSHPNLWYNSAIINSYADTSDIDDMIDYNHHKAKKFSKGEYPSDSLYKLSWTLTPSTQAIADSILPNKPHSLKGLALTANPKLPDFFDYLDDHQYKPGNILIIDFCEKSDIVELISKFNSKK